MQEGGDLVWQVGTGSFGCRTKDGNFFPVTYEQWAPWMRLRWSRSSSPRGQLGARLHSANGKDHLWLRCLKRRPLDNVRPRLCAGPQVQQQLLSGRDYHPRYIVDRRAECGGQGPPGDHRRRHRTDGCLGCLLRQGEVALAYLPSRRFRHSEPLGRYARCRKRGVLLREAWARARADHFGGNPWRGVLPLGLAGAGRAAGTCILRRKVKKARAAARRLAVETGHGKPPAVTCRRFLSDR